MIALILFSVFGIAMSISDTLLFHYNTSRFADIPKESKWHKWLDASVSHLNKYKNGKKSDGARFFLSDTVFVIFTDGWHFFKAVGIVSAVLGSYLCSGIIELLIFFIVGKVIFEVSLRWLGKEEVFRWPLMLLLLIVLGSCSAPKQLITTSQIIKGDTVTVTEYVSLTRQERLAIKDSMKHERKLYKDSTDFELKHAKTINKRLSDSLGAVVKLAKIEIRELKLINEQLKDSLKYNVKEKKVDNKHEEKVQKQEDKQEIKLKKKSNWWVWLLVGLLVASILMNVSLIVLK